MNFARSKGLSVPAEGDSILSWSLGRKLTGPLRLGRRAPRNVGLQRRVAQIVDAIIYDIFQVPAFTVVCRKSAMN